MDPKEAESSERLEGEEEEAEMVMSEIHLGCSPFIKTSFTRFPISPSIRYRPYEKITSTSELAIDEEGDLILYRRKKSSAEETNDEIVLHHHVKTGIPLVGLQIWRASLLLGDFVLNSIVDSDVLNDAIAVELGAGTGLVGILAGRTAKTVFITDYEYSILENCSRNIELNSHTFKYDEDSVLVRQLDWNGSWPPERIADDEYSTRDKNNYSWTSSDIEKVQSANVFLAADVIYSNGLTYAFFSMLEKLMPPQSKKILFLSIEKRYNFTMEDLDVVAHGYDYFRTFFEEIPEFPGSMTPRRAGIDEPYFIGKRIDIGKIPQSIQEYDRGSDTELWEIRSRPSSSVHGKSPRI